MKGCAGIISSVFNETPQTNDSDEMIQQVTQRQRK